jgi:hypothetical protein
MLVHDATRSPLWFALIAVFLFAGIGWTAEGGGKKRETTNLRIEVSGGERPVRGVGVFVMMEDDGWSEEDTTNSKGVVSFSGVPRGKVLIQINERDWKNFGRYYSLSKPEETVRVTLEKKEEPKKDDQ